MRLQLADVMVCLCGMWLGITHGWRSQVRVFAGAMNDMADLHTEGVVLALEDQTNIIFSDEAIEITHLPGTSGTAVVSFAGIGMGFGGVQIEEFRRSLAGTPNDLIFVKDKSRTWFNKSFDKVGEILEDALQRLLVRDTISIGNSMGAFGAIAFAARLPN